MIEEPIALYGAVASTNEIALKALQDGARAGTVILADSQEAGRGRRHGDGERRRWFSPARKNLYVSVVIRPRVPAERLAPITLAVGASVVEMLRRETGADLWLKWPNDIYAGDRKVGGILTEGSMGSRGLEGAVVGLGLNCNAGASDFPEELRGIATSLREVTGQVVDRLTLGLSASRAIAEAAQAYEEGGLPAFLSRIEALDRLKGREVIVVNGEEEKRGEAQGIGAGGGLLVHYEDGSDAEVTSGEVRIPSLGVDEER